MQASWNPEARAAGMGVHYLAKERSVGLTGVCLCRVRQALLVEWVEVRLERDPR